MKRNQPPTSPKTIRSTIVLLSLLLLACPKSGRAAPANLESKPAKTVRLLTVGNSFSQNATRFLERLASASGHVLIHHQAVIGGASLAQHWEKAEQYEKDPQDQRGFYGTNRSLQQELRAEPWDFVTIQQASIQSHNLATYRPYAGQLQAYIKKYARHAEVLIHETWAYRCDDPRFAVSFAKPGEPATQADMYQGLRAAYTTIAAELGLRLIPVGDAFHLADAHPTWGYRPDREFDFKNAQPPHLPNQTHSLHGGWSWARQADGKPALRLDGHHAGIAGEYLGACVFYEMLFGGSGVGYGFVPPGLAAAEARFLQETAHQAMLDVPAHRAANPQ